MGRERLLAIVLAGLLAAMAPSAFATQGNVTLNSVLVDAPEKGWYSSGDIVFVSGIISNAGDATSITVDPSCNEVLRIWSEGQLVIDGTTSCLGQSRGLDIGANSESTLDTLTWDLRNSEGEYVPSGDYTVEYYIAGEGLSSSVDIHVQTPFDIPEELEMTLTASSRDGVHAEASPSILTVRLANTLNEKIDLELQNCALVINSKLQGDCGPNSLRGLEVVTIAQIPVDLSAGENTFSVSIGDSQLRQDITIIAIEDVDQGVNSGQLDEMTLDLQLPGDLEFEELEIFSPDILLKNNGDSDVSLDFDTSCLGEIWVVDSSGSVVMDSRFGKDCTNLEVEYSIQPGTDRIFSQSDWSFIDMTGCHVTPGELTVIMEIPEHDLYGTEVINLLRERDDYCIDSTISINAEFSGEDALSISPEISSPTSSELTWFNSCGVVSTLYKNGQEIDNFLSQCYYNSTITVQFTTMELETFEMDMSPHGEGEFTVVFETLTAPITKSTVSFSWPLEIESESQDTTEEVIEELDSRIISGTWSATSNDLGTCWLLNTQEEGILTLAGAQGLVSWSPKVGTTGDYLVQNSEPAPECSDFASQSFTIQEVYKEELLFEDDDDETIIVTETPVESPEEQISPAVVTITVAVASTGILSLLVAGIATNESWRIPATSAGLWLLGLVGRTSETSDGRYQRGRLMGYLTANPGCHFRALMAALEMSNGQITHHLKILEDEGRIWRRADGRLVRFYPYTSNLHPGVLDQDLPMPPLSPDPNSLQGKILRLLDDDGQMKKFPTQAELAHRLDRSQQLVSHHLRTLQKYGLVQKQKSGLKNRYCLTKEAIFLLETTEL
ncbi:MAG: winged helix-turn-helix transcriptional regulator [Candidatus Poseidoniaceae archaeon]